jgi:hypothetical protein
VGLRGRSYGQFWPNVRPQRATRATALVCNTHAFRHEKKIEVRLHEHGISTFLPWARQIHRWSDRRKLIELPLSRAMPLSISSRMLRHRWPFSELMG